MKLRIKGPTLRLRLTQGEIRALHAQFRHSSRLPELSFAQRANCVQPFRSKAIVVEHCAISINIQTERQRILAQTSSQLGAEQVNLLFQRYVPTTASAVSQGFRHVPIIECLDGIAARRLLLGTTINLPREGDCR